MEGEEVRKSFHAYSTGWMVLSVEDEVLEGKMRSFLAYLRTHVFVVKQSQKVYHIKLLYKTCRIFNIFMSKIMLPKLTTKHACEPL